MAKHKNLLCLLACVMCAAATMLGVTFMGGAKRAKADENVISGATLTLGSSVSLRFYADSEITDLTCVFGIKGEKSAPVSAKNDDSGRTYFDFEIAPHLMGESVTATLYAGGDYDTALAQKSYGAAEYCKAKIAGEDDDGLKTLCADILAYGAAAQVYKNYNADALVNAENAGEPTEFKEIGESESALSGEIDENNAFVAGNCFFDGFNGVCFILKTDDISALNVTAQKNGEEADYEIKELTDGKYAVIVRVTALNFDTVYSATITKGELSQTAAYSIKSYVYKFQSETGENGELTAMAKLSRALYNYGTSSKNWYYMPVLSQTDEEEMVKAGETLVLPEVTATNRAGDELSVSVLLDGEEYNEKTAVFYAGEYHELTYEAECNGLKVSKTATVNVDFDGVNLADVNYLTTATKKFYGMFGATFVAANGPQHIGAFMGKKVYDEEISVGINTSNFVGSISFNLRGGRNAELETINKGVWFTSGSQDRCTGLWAQVENSGGGRIKIYVGDSEIYNTDNYLPDSQKGSGYWDPILQNPFDVRMQATDVVDGNGDITDVNVKVYVNGTAYTGENGVNIAVTSDNVNTIVAPGWFSIHAGSNTDWMKKDAYVHSIYLNTPNYPVNLLLSGWSVKNSSGETRITLDQNGIKYASNTEQGKDNVYTDNSRSYTDYGSFDSLKVKDQKIKVLAKAAFKSGDEFCVYFRGNNYPNNNWRWIRRGLFVSFDADDGVRICLGEAAFSYGNETEVYVTYSNEQIKALFGGKTIADLFIGGVTLEMQATDVTDESGNAIAVNVRIWINGVSINGDGYKAEKIENFDRDGVTGDAIFNGGVIMLGGKVTDTEGYISGVYVIE